MYNCLNCNDAFNYRRNTTNKYCDNRCQKEFEGKKKVTDWLSGTIQPTKSIVLRYLKEKFGYFCSVCNIKEWNGTQITFEIDHIDGNSRNNHPSNFRLICPNCHSQTATFKGRNRGNGRSKITKNYTISPCS